MSTVAERPRARRASAPPAPLATVRHGKCSLHLSIGGTRYRLHPLTPPAGFKVVWSLRKQADDHSATYQVAVEKGQVAFGYGVYVAGLASQADTYRALVRLERNGIKDALVMPESTDAGRRLSLGLYSDRSRAERRAHVGAEVVDGEILAVGLKHGHQPLADGVGHAPAFGDGADFCHRDKFVPAPLDHSRTPD